MRTYSIFGQISMVAVACIVACGLNLASLVGRHMRTVLGAATVLSVLLILVEATPPAVRHTAHATSALVTSIGAGNIHACAGMDDGTAWCWGNNAEAQLGNAATGTGNSLWPVAVDTLSGAGTLNASNAAYHTCVLAGASTVKCWGSNSNGQLGRGTLGGQFTTPQSVSIPGVTQATADYRHTCAIRTGGVSCWGLNADGQLGDGTTTDRSSPVPVVGLPGTATDIDAGLNKTCAVVSGAVWCWGFGVGSTPATVPGISTAVDVAVGNNHQCAALSSGHVVCWGLGTSGQLGNGSFSNSSTPVETGLIDAVAVDVGGGHSCALRSGGNVVCWGDNSAGQLGDGTTTNRASSVAAIGVSSASGIATGGAFTCASLTAGGAKCWGSNFYGELGDCTLVDRHVAVSVDLTHRCDTDGDGLPDYWETTGDVNDDGIMDLNLPAMGANPHVKDLFLEIDWMDCAVPGSDCAPGHDDAPDPRALAAVIAHFWCAPERIVIHIDAGPASVMNPTVDTCTARNVSGPTWGPLATGGPLVHDSTPLLLAADTRGPNRTKVFHLAELQHAVPDISPGRPAGGYGQVPGVRLWLGLGQFSFPQPITNTQLWQSQAATLIHETGHNLGLSHGGTEPTNYKPNHLSIMNYAFGAGLIVNGTINETWDYSRTTLDDLDEAHLSEPTGLEPDASVNPPGIPPKIFGTIWLCANGGGIATANNHFGVAANAAANVDWNCSGSEGGGPAGTCVDGLDNDSNGLTDQQDPACTVDPAPLPPVDIGGSEINVTPGIAVLHGHDDWSSLNFGGGAIGSVRIAGGGALVQSPMALSSLHGDVFEEVPLPDTDGDGLLDGAEVSLGTNPNNPDTDGDGLPDGREVGVLGTSPTNPDTDGDGYTDGAEVTLGENPLVYCNIMRADINGDGAVNGLDLNILAKRFLQSVPPAPARVDQNSDNSINALDLNRLAKRFLQNVSACP